MPEPSSFAAPRVAVDLAPVGLPGASWTELTGGPAQGGGAVHRVGAPYLVEAQRRAARARRTQPGAVVFVDVRAHVAPDAATAFAQYARLDPGWAPGRVGEDITYVGTPAGLAGLVWDVWAAGVADGVTLRAFDPRLLLRSFHREVAPLLAARGVGLLRQPAPWESAPWSAPADVLAAV